MERQSKSKTNKKQLKQLKTKEKSYFFIRVRLVRFRIFLGNFF